MSTFLRGALVALCVLSSAPAAATDDDEDESDAEAAPADAPTGGAAAHQEGDYGGVVPGRAAAATKSGRASRKVRRAREPLVTWIGFQVRDAGGARVFLQLSADAPHEQNLVGDKLVVFVAGARLGTRNHGRFIDTTFFDTRIAKIEARNVRARRGQKRGVELTVHFKKGGATQAQASREGELLLLDFAPAG